VELGCADTCPVRLVYQLPANSTFLSEQTSHQQPVSRTFLAEQISTSHQPNEHGDNPQPYTYFPRIESFLFHIHILRLVFPEDFF
jgi:hypothetical protein